MESGWLLPHFVSGEVCQNFGVGKVEVPAPAELGGPTPVEKVPDPYECKRPCPVPALGKWREQAGGSVVEVAGGAGPRVLPGGWPGRPGPGPDLVAGRAPGRGRDRGAGDRPAVKEPSVKEGEAIQKLRQNLGHPTSASLARTLRIGGAPDHL